MTMAIAWIKMFLLCLVGAGVEVAFACIVGRFIRFGNSNEDQP